VSISRFLAFLIRFYVVRKYRLPIQSCLINRLKPSYPVNNLCLNISEIRFNFATKVYQMSNNKDLLKALKLKEKEIIEEIETTELGKQLKGIRSTIALFENGSSNSDVMAHTNGVEIPKTFQDAVTWNGKVMFALHKIGSGFVDDIVAELKKYNISGETDDSLKRKVSIYASSLKTKKQISGKPIGIKVKYFIK
jgi:hypothetical protein